MPYTEDEDEYTTTAEACRGRHSFLVGGPLINRLSRDLISANADRLPYVPSDTGFQATSLGPSEGVTAIDVDFEESSGQAVDYSMLLKLKSAAEPSLFSFVFMGARQFATCGAVAALLDDTWVSCVMPKARMRDEFQVIWQNRSGISDPWPVGGRFVTDVLSVRP